MALELILALGIGACAALAALLGQMLLNSGRRPAPVSVPSALHEPAVFLLQGGAILNATATAWRLIEAVPGAEDWADIHAALHKRFPRLPQTLPESAVNVPATDGSSALLVIQPEGATTRVTVTGPPPSAADLHHLFLMREELDLLRDALATAPHPIWQCDAAGQVLWCNVAYDRLAAQTDHTSDTPLFDLPLPQVDEPSRNRTSVCQGAQNARLWFEVCSARSGDTWLNYAADIDAVVRAETAQRNFVQTLTKTFAHLPIGLAVFDRERRLALFNPALIDLTNLPADFLSRRPNLLSFFDNMRDNRMMPEPKNYSNWREQMADLVAAASDDRYCETWSLPSGLTYKITGRPHPDGAVAFLLEDISAEITLTRRFRSELDLSQSVLDCIDDAIAVFSPLGVLTYSNAAYRDLWKSDPDSAFCEVTVIEATRQWQAACKASPIWGDIRDFVLTLRERAAWDSLLSMSDGTRLVCHVEPVSGGATVVRFRPTDLVPDQAAPPRIHFADA